ncbi:MAG TPA: EAL domain-containing protein, partial [Rhodocyclaceae bacterium]|nr:EAL domain-containing protein [Rhodocyclaceae bacterium]
GTWLANFSYQLAGHPCRQTVAEGFFATDGVSKDTHARAFVLHDFGMTAYAGQCVGLGEDGARGLLVILCSTPFRNIELIKREFAVVADQLERRSPALSTGIALERAAYAALVRDEFYNEYVRDNQEGISFSEYMPPVPVDLPEDEQIERLLHTAHVVECNRAIAGVYGYASPEAMLGVTPFELNGPVRGPKILAYWIRCNYALRDVESQTVDAEGKITWTRGGAVGQVVDGKVTHFWTKYHDISSQKRYEAAIQHKAHHDPLTGLPNRYWFQDRMDVLSREHQQRGTRFCLALLDLNGFKEINDTLGHTIGDQLLQAISIRLLHGLKKGYGAEIARLGGDEFAILLGEVSGTADCEAMAATVQELLKAPFPIEGMNLQIGGALGLTLYAGTEESAADLLRQADVAMYAAKHEGRPYGWYQVAMDQYSRRRLFLLNSLSQAVEQNQLFLAYQPKIDLANGRLSGYEALVRWNHPEMGVIPPGDFIPYAETNEVIGPMTRWVIKEALRQAAVWRSAGLDLTMAINLSARNLADDSLIDFLMDCLATHDYPAGNVELEITESTLMMRPAQAMEILLALRQRGFNIAIDDFGTGYSSLAYLARLPVSSLKVDQAFVKDMLRSKTDEQIVRSVISLAHECQLNVVAEGVEDEAVLAALRTMGCDLAQGFFIARPMVAAQAEAWMATYRP